MNVKPVLSNADRVSLVVWCASDGTIERIEHDACQLVVRGCGSRLADLVDPSSRDKVALFFEKVQDAAVLLDWECTVQLDGTLRTLKISGIKADASLLVLADPEAITLQHILMETGSLYCLGGALLQSVIDTYGCSGSHIDSQNSHLYNEIIRLSNQQAALHRELSKKTVALESRTAELNDLNRVLTTITDGIQDSILLLDSSSRVLWANQAAQSIRREDLIGSHCHQSLKDADRTCETSDTFCPINQALASGKPECGEHIHLDPQGNRIYNEVTVYPIRNDDNEIAQLVIISKDITRRKQMEELLLQETLTDALTGIPNRRAFEQHLTAEWRRAVRDKSPLTVAMIDIDLFKSYNDFYGHQQGDVCLRRVATSIQKTLRRPGDLVARYGGEEFVVVLPNTDADSAKTITDTIQANLKKCAIPHKQSAVADTVTVSIGVASKIPTLENSAEKLLFTADKALYTAKRLGRNRVHRIAAHPAKPSIEEKS